MPKSERPRETRLSRELQQAVPSRRITPRDAFELALAKWMNGDRVEVGAIAGELGVAKATVFRWVGSRELLLGEIIWSLLDAAWKHVLSVARGTGADYAADVTYRLMASVLRSVPFRRFLEQDPENALRILTSKTSIVRTRIVDEVCKMLRELVETGHIAPALKIEDLAYIIVRVFESCLYSDQIAGTKPNIELTSEAIRILVGARSASEPTGARPSSTSTKPRRRKRTQ
ncbi:QsdR family transcriptional regulator [Paraburkholderia megapolitana]|uniref:QsdR family transcriptional regulator n=1 Tax=Paraburkholderia megapolitana TaxID=420953 RepID=UPI0038BD3C27